MLVATTFISQPSISSGIAQPLKCRRNSTVLPSQYTRCAFRQVIFPTISCKMYCSDIFQDTRFVIGASADNACRLWAIETGRIRHTLTGMTEEDINI